MQNRKARFEAQASCQSTMTAGVWVWKDIRVDTHPQVFFVASVRLTKGVKEKAEQQVRVGAEERCGEGKERRADGWTDWGS